MFCLFQFLGIELFGFQSLKTGFARWFISTSTSWDFSETSPYRGVDSRCVCLMSPVFCDGDIANPVLSAHSFKWLDFFLVCQPAPPPHVAPPEVAGLVIRAYCPLVSRNTAG